MNFIERDKQNIWHPFTQMKTAFPPVHIERAKGAMLIAADGIQYIDAVSSWWVNIHGHSNEYIANRIAEQAKKLEHVIFAGFTHTPAIELAERLIELLPEHFSKVFFSDNGSTSVEVAVKMALQYWHNKNCFQKTKIIAFENAYHGDTFGAMSVGGKSAFNKPFQEYLFDVTHIALPNENNIEQLKTQLEALVKEYNVAAFIFEPLILGAGGMLMYTPEHLDELLKIANAHSVICIADEVMTGFGRTGRTFAINYLKQQPDIICLSKGITGGFMPLGVTVCSERIFEAFYSDEKEKTFFHGHSYTANPLACEAANASLFLLSEEKCRTEINAIVSAHVNFLQMLKNLKKVTNVRMQGTILAFEIITPEGSSYFNTIQKEAYSYFMERGVLLRPLGNTIYIMPPYCITPEELNKVYEVILDFISQLTFTP